MQEGKIILGMMANVKSLSALSNSCHLGIPNIAYGTIGGCFRPHEDFIAILSVDCRDGILYDGQTKF